jgi:hypothetical protein
MAVKSLLELSAMINQAKPEEKSTIETPSYSTIISFTTPLKSLTMISSFNSMKFTKIVEEAKSSSPQAKSTDPKLMILKEDFSVRANRFKPPDSQEKIIKKHMTCFLIKIKSLPKLTSVSITFKGKISLEELNVLTCPFDLIKALKVL